MRPTTSKFLAAALFVTMLPACDLAGAGEAAQVDQALGASVAVEAGALTAEQAEHLLRLREEEKLARDVYLTFAERWEQPVFSNIARSEQRHMDAVARLLAAHGLVDPVTDDARGVFSAPAFQALYGELVAQGSATVGDALAVGAAIEELDLADLDLALATAPPADVVRVFENLSRGSRNHLRAFAGQLEAIGRPYAPTSLSAEEVEAIVSTPRERGGRAAGAGGGAAAGACPQG